MRAIRPKAKALAVTSSGDAATDTTVRLQRLLSAEGFPDPDKLVTVLKGAWELTTWTQYCERFERWLKYAEKQGFDWTRANENHIYGYFLLLAFDCGLTAATVKVTLSSISSICKLF